MKTLTAALLAGAICLVPLAASAQSHGGGHGGGGHAGGGGGGYRGGGYGGGYRGYGGGYRGYGYGLGGFGLGLALGAAYDPWYYGGYGYYPSYYGYAPYGYGYAPGYDYDDEDEYGSPPPQSYSAPAAARPAQACGQWVWHADQNKYQWASGACT